MRLLRNFSRFIGATLILSCGLPAAAQNPDFHGTYVVDAGASDKVDDAIDRSIASMNFIKRPIARSRLQKTNPVYQRVGISLSATTIGVTFDTRKPIDMPASGAAVPWAREDGEKFEVSAKRVDDRLIQHFKAADGERTNIFSLSADGKILRLQVTLASPKLPEPLKYALVYARERS